MKAQPAVAGLPLRPRPVLAQAGDYEVDFGETAWRREVRLVLDSGGSGLSVETSGAAVPLDDGRLQPPTFEAGPTTAFWSPPPDTPKGPRVVAREELVSGGEWPAGSP